MFCGVQTVATESVQQMKSLCLTKEISYFEHTPSEERASSQETKDDPQPPVALTPPTGSTMLAAKPKAAPKMKRPGTAKAKAKSKSKKSWVSKERKRATASPKRKPARRTKTQCEKKLHSAPCWQVLCLSCPCWLWTWLCKSKEGRTGGKDLKGRATSSRPVGPRKQLWWIWVRIETFKNSHLIFCSSSDLRYLLSTNPWEAVSDFWWTHRGGVVMKRVCCVGSTSRYRGKRALSTQSARQARACEYHGVQWNIPPGPMKRPKQPDGHMQNGKDPLTSGRDVF